jgi:5-methyltetrahydrofolate--homocysteine methyltransferase
MADYAIAARDLGANYIGSCCGSIASHVREMAYALGKKQPDGRPWRVDYDKPMSAFEYYAHKTD